MEPSRSQESVGRAYSATADEQPFSVPRPLSLPNNGITVNSSPPGSSQVVSQLARDNRSPTAAKLDVFKSWSISTYKCTKQMIAEKLGKSSRTIDTDLENHIERIRDTQKKYMNILRLAKNLVTHFQAVVDTQSSLGEAFTELAQKSPELQDEFNYNAITQRNLSKHGEILLSALNFFISSLTTLCTKTIEDSLLTIKNYELARVEYDAYRSDLETLTQRPRNEVSPTILQETQRKHEEKLSEYEKFRDDVNIKLKFLDENRVKVMHKQLLLFHNAVSAYFSGNQVALEATLKQFNIALKQPNSAPSSWLEQR
ncbi:arfaptin-2-like isoform X2 [Artemia franciscana]|nr:hypothetical protein QYM36_006665 [Artemia franciscana]